MKTISRIFCVALNLVFLGTALSQATFEMYNYSPSHGVDAPIFDAQGVPLAGSDYLAELWGGATVDSLAPAIDYNYSGGRLIVPFFSQGYFYDFRSAFVFSVPGGGQAWLQVRVWDANLGDTYEEVAALGLGGYNSSAVFYAQGGDPGPNPTLPGPLVGLESFSLLPVIPEPSVWALLGLGGTVLWVTKRWRR